MTERPMPFAQVYVSCAVLGFAASFVPLYVPKESGDIYETLTIGSSITEYGSATGVLAVLLILVLVGLALASGARRPSSLALPAALLLVSVIGALMLLARVGEGSYPPSFGAGAGLLFGTAVALALTTVAEIVVALRKVDVRAAHHDG